MAKKQANKMQLAFLDPSINEEKMEKVEAGEDIVTDPLIKSIISSIRKHDNVSRLAFQEDPNLTHRYGGLFFDKTALIPDRVLKRIAIVDDLVADCVIIRSQQISSFGRPLLDKYSTGLRIEPDPAIFKKMPVGEQEKLLGKIKEVTRKLISCGKTEDLKANELMSLSRFLYLSARNAVVFGRFATEIVYELDLKTHKKKFRYFRPVDSGTIYRAIPKTDALAKLREQALERLKSLENRDNEKLDPNRFEKDEYAWVQVIEGTPQQAFTADEMFVHDCFPTTDIELNGYPLTPIDCAIAAITTHINITTTNKMYFQNGRASHGMLVIQSEDVDPQTLADLKQQFTANINDPGKAFRVPVFKVGIQDKVSWQTMEETKDMEFQFLYETNCRILLAAFQMSPDEVPGYSHLSKGTNSQSLSECLDFSTRILTPNGLQSIEKFLNGEKEKQGIIWTGKDWKEGRAFVSGKKKLMQTELSNGIKIKTSPDHKFLSFDNNGDLLWKEQNSLNVGDILLVNKKPNTGINHELPSFNGKILTPEMMEILGWSLGDGTLCANKDRAGAQFHLFYHHEMEQDIWENHKQTLEEFGLVVKHVKKDRTQEEIDYIKTKYGFNSVAPFTLRNIVYNTDFYRWLCSIGFRSSNSGKAIPEVIYSMPIEYRQAFLRGFFSADGGKLDETGSVCITIQNDIIRDQTRQLLLGLGIRTLPPKGVLRRTFGNKKSFSYKLYIKDRREFWSQIGFIQPHKQLLGNPEKWQIGSVPRKLIEKFIPMCINSDKFHLLDKRLRDNIKALVAWNINRNCSLDFLKRTMDLCGISCPQWMNDFHMEKVSDIKDLDALVEMADIEIFSDEHAFMAEGFIVHNSKNEWKLEAGRDVGIRPLMSHFQDFLNSRILPLLDPELAEICTLKLYGLDSTDPEQENARLAEEIQISATYDDVMRIKEKDPLGKEWAGEYPLSDAIQMVHDKFFTVGELREHFLGIKGASQDPKWAYVRDTFYFQHQTVLQAQQQMDEAKKMAEQQSQAPQSGDGKPPPPGDSGGNPGKNKPSQPGSGSGEQQSPAAPPDEGVTNLVGNIDQVISLLAKNEPEFKEMKKRFVQHHDLVVRRTMDEWERESKKVLAEISDLSVQNKRD